MKKVFYTTKKVYLTLGFIKMKYNIIYADPPWQYGSKSAVNNSNGSEIKKLSEHYNSMTIDDIKSIDIKGITEDDACCFMWVTDSHLKEGIEVMESWGFKYKTVAFVWVKTTNKGNYCKNVAPWTLKSTELCLFGTKGTMTKYKKNNSIESLVFAERFKHSQKPEEVRSRIESLFGDLPKLELFARSGREGWTTVGNAIDGMDINESLELLKHE